MKHYAFKLDVKAMQIDDEMNESFGTCEDKIKEAVADTRDSMKGWPKKGFLQLGGKVNVKNWCRRCAVFTRLYGRKPQYKVGAPFEKVVIHVGEPFSKNRSVSRFTSCLEDVNTLPFQLMIMWLWEMI